MSLFSDSLSISSIGLTLQSHRLKAVAQNIANTDTPGYKRKLVSFSELEPNKDRASSTRFETLLDNRAGERVYEPGHPLADRSGHYISSNVDLVMEIADAHEAQRGYEANLKMFDQVRQMSSGLMDLLHK